MRSDAAPFCANTSDFHDAVIDAAYEAETTPSTVVIDMVTTANVDVTASEGMLQLYEELGALGIELKPARVGSVAESGLDEQGIVDAVGPDSIYPTVRDAVDAARPRDV